MITTAEFKSQISKPFGIEMRKLGFKGTGFNYVKENEDFLFLVYIDASRWGRSCSVGLVVHPKKIDKNSIGNLDLKKLKAYQYEFPMPLSETPRNDHWQYSDVETENLQTLQKIITIIKSKALPVITLFSEKPTVLDMFDVAELSNFHDSYTQKTGTSIATIDTRFAWAMAMIFEFTNPGKASLFAEYGMSQLTADDTFFDRKHFERILK